MHTIHRAILRLGVAGLLIVALLSAWLPSGAKPALAAPPAPPLPAATCALNGTIRSCDLYAKSGPLALSATVNVTIWGYAATAAGSAGLPGPTIIANAGETLEITLYNNLTEPTSLAIPALEGPSDMDGVEPGASKVYAFADLPAGTYLYEAGMTENGARQVALGLFGALIVRPAGVPGQAYASPNSTFDSEGLLVLSEIDPALHAGPASYDMQLFTPKYRLINGKIFPDTANIAAPAGGTLLLRYLNAGSLNHAIGVLGLRQSIIAVDGTPLNAPVDMVARTLPAGQARDVLVTIPTGVPDGTLYPLYNTGVPAPGTGGRAGVGGMITFIEVSAADITGPVTSDLQVNPTLSNGIPLALSASVSDAASGGSNVTGAEYFIDTDPGQGNGMPMSGAFGASVVSVNASVDIASLADGNHTISVRGRDAAGNWGAPIATGFSVDQNGPTINSVAVTPSPTEGATSVSLTATATDTTSTIAEAEYFIGANDPGAGNGTALSASDGAFDSQNEGLTASIDLAGLADGSYTVSVRARDAAGNWGTPASTTFQVTSPPPPSGLIFSDSFETGNLSAWTSSSTTSGASLAVTTAAAMEGSYGLEARLNRAGQAYVIDGTPNAATSYRARFRYDPNSANFAGGTQNIFVGRTGTTNIFIVQARFNNGNYQVRAQVRRLNASGNTGLSSTSWYTITDGPHSIEIAWQSASASSFTLSIDGVLRQTLNNQNTSPYTLDVVWLGPSAGTRTANTGVEYFDDFFSTDGTAITP